MTLTPPPAPVRIGEKLRVARLDRRLSLEETAWRTRIRPDLLRALEDEEFGELGHHTTARSHLSSYARFLGMDASELVVELDARQPEPAPSAIEELHRQQRESRKPPRAKWLIFAAASALVLAATSTIGWLGGRAERPATPIAEVAADPGPAAPISPAETRVELRVVALAATQVSVLADGSEVFEGQMRQGQRRTFRARDSLELLSADGGAVTLTLNGERLGPLGRDGEVARARFGPTGLLGE